MTDHEGNSISRNLVQYHAHFAPMVIEKWALPFFTDAGFLIDTKLPIARMALSVPAAKSVTTIMAMNLMTMSLRSMICIFVIPAIVRIIGNA